MKLTLVSPRGFCAGVERAIKIVELALQKFGAPVYVKHAIVHNDHVLKRLEKLGAIFVEEIAEVPQGSVLIYSAHGVAQEVYLQSQSKGLIEIDATCSLVTRIHSAVRRYQNKGYQIILIGYRNHVEVQGTYGWAKENTTIVENLMDVERLQLDQKRPIFMTSQTTLSLIDIEDITQAIKNKYPHVETLPKGSICYATTNRQMALWNALDEADCVIVVGDQKSSNSKKLYELGLKKGVHSYLISDASQLDLSLIRDKTSVVLTAGASTPDNVTENVIKKISEIENCHINEYIDQFEDVHFALPSIVV